MANLEELQLLGMGSKNAAKFSRGIFRDLITKLGDAQTITQHKYGWDEIPYTIKNIVNKLPAEQQSYGAAQALEPLVQQSGIDRLKPIADIVSKPNGNPIPLVSEAVSTGKLNGVKLSSQQRQELATRLALHKIVSTQDFPLENRLTYDTLSSPNLGEALTQTNSYNPAALFEQVPWWQKSIGNKPDTTIADKISAITNSDKYDSLSPAEKTALARVANYNNNNTVFNTLYPNNAQGALTHNNNWDWNSLIEKAYGLKGTGGKGYANRATNKAITNKLTPDLIYNSLISKYKITNPEVANTIKTMMPEWNGTGCTIQWCT